jgi:hypothetical protein
MAAAANEREWKKEWNVWLVGKENSRLIGSAAVFFFRVCYSSVLACPFVEEWRRNLEPSPVFFSTLTTTNVERKNNLTFFSKYLNNLARTHGVVGPERNTRWPPRHDTFFLSSFKTFFRMRNDCGKNRPHQKEKNGERNMNKRARLDDSLDARERWQSFLYNSLLALVYLFIVIALFLKELHKLKQEGNVREGKVP